MNRMCSQDCHVVAMRRDDELPYIIRYWRLDGLGWISKYIDNYNQRWVYSVALCVLLVFRVILKAPIMASALVVLLVFPGLLEVDQIRPSNFLANSYEDFRTAVRNGSSRPGLCIPLNTFIKRLKSRCLTS